MNVDPGASEDRISDAKNIYRGTVDSFSEQWVRFDQSSLSVTEKQKIFDQYFENFPWNELPANAEGFDMGCGTGRWATLVAPRVGKLNCVDAAPGALEVAKKNLAAFNNVNFVLSSVDKVPLKAGSQDFGYALGVFHYIPDALSAFKTCVSLLKPGAPFLVYLYYNFDNRPFWFRSIWKVSDVFRRAISSLRPGPKTLVSDSIAALVYWPIAKICRVAEMAGLNLTNMPLYAYRDKSFYTMRTDSRDRFGSPMEHRFSRNEVSDMMLEAGLVNIVFCERIPYWCAVGRKKV